MRRVLLLLCSVRSRFLFYSLHRTAIAPAAGDRQPTRMFTNGGHIVTKNERRNTEVVVRAVHYAIAITTLNQGLWARNDLASTTVEEPRATK